MDTNRAIATAKRLIDKNGQAVVWRKPAPTDVTASPWRDVRAGDPNDTPVKILWIKPTLRSLAFLQNIAKTDIPDGVEQAIMAAQAFTPELADSVVIDGLPLSLFRVDAVKPNGVPIIWTLWIKRGGAA